MKSVSFEGCPYNCEDGYIIDKSGLPVICPNCGGNTSLTDILPLKFEGCPYNCVDGVLYDFNNRGYTKCPHCSKKRKEMVINGNGKIGVGVVKNKTLQEVLGINNKYITPNFEFDSVIAQSERHLIKEEKVEYMRRELIGVYEKLVLGETPDISYCFGLGHYGAVERVAYPFFYRAYAAGLSVTGLLTIDDIINRDHKVEIANFTMERDKALKDVNSMLSADVCIVLIPNGVSTPKVNVARGLMGRRAVSGRSTIFLTCWTADQCSILLSPPERDSLELAKGVFVSYVSTEKNGKVDKYTQNLLKTR